MTPETIALRSDLHYLLPAAPSFWRWSADGACVEWADGRTIAFRDELLTVLDRLAPGGLPPLEAILLVMAATKPGWAVDDRVALIARTVATERSAPTIVNTLIDRRIRPEAMAVLERLQSVAELAEPLRRSTAAKASLLDFIFRGSRPVSAPAAEQIVAELRRGLDSGTRQTAASEDAVQRLSGALAALDLGLNCVAGDVVELWQNTGIDFELEPADIALPPAARTRTLLSELKADEDLGGIARVAADVLAAVHIPRVLNRANDLPLGGVSDVSNKGNLDQLLLSELAHDDLTLAVRVAMGEALYLRREAPALHPPVGRWIVIDSGIRLWGTPRLFATAVALALAAGGDDRAPLSVFRANGDRPDPVDLTTRRGVVDHLSKLLASPDPVPAMRAAADRIRADTDAGAQAELILVTHEETAGDPAVLRALAAMASERLTVRVAALTADGAFSLARVAAGGRADFVRATLSLERLAAEPRRSTGTSGVEELSRDASLPTILRLKEFPLLLPAVLLPQLAAYTPETGVVGLSGDRRLMQWTGKDVGARQLSDRLPLGSRVEAVVADAAGMTVTVVISRKRSNQILLHTQHVQTGAVRVLTVAGSTVRHVTQQQGALLVILPRQVVSVLPGEAQPRTLPVGDDRRWVNGRFFRGDGGETWAATATGWVQAGRTPHAADLFDHDTLGPVRMNSIGHYTPLIDAPPIAIPTLARVRIDWSSLRFARNGHRLIARGSGADVWYCADLDRRESQKSSRTSAFAFLLGPECAWCDQASRYQLQHRLPAIGRGKDGVLTLRPGRKPRCILLDSSGTLRLSRVAPPGPGAVDAVQPFVAVPRIAGRTLGLHKATWADGSTAWLDARGMLHLVSSDASLAQITLVLQANDHPLAGWLSTGQLFGPPYFTQRLAQVSDRTVMTLLNRFAAALR